MKHPPGDRVFRFFRWDPIDHIGFLWSEGKLSPYFVVFDSNPVDEVCFTTNRWGEKNPLFTFWRLDAPCGEPIPLDFDSGIEAAQLAVVKVLCEAQR